MSIPFDPYYKWLGIPPAEQPPHHYRLLGINPFEADRDVIETAADGRMALLRTFHAGPNSDQSQQLLNEVAAAKLCLLKPDRRASYDEQLRRRLEQTPARSAAPVQAPPTPAPIYAPPTLAVDLPTWKEPIPAPKAAAPKPAASAEPVATIKPAAVANTADVTGAATGIRLAAKPAMSRAAAWDLAVAEACAAQSAIPRRRRRWWRIGPYCIQLVFGAAVIAGLAYAGLIGFTKWQEEEFRHGTAAPRLSFNGSAAPVPGTASNSATSVPNGSSLPPAGSVASSAGPVPRAESHPNNGNPAVNNFGLPTAGQPTAPSYSPPGTVPGPTPVNPPGGNSATTPLAVRAPVPTAEAQRKSAKVLQEVLKDDYQQARGIDGHLALAHTLADLAIKTTDDPTTRYVAASQALELAVKFCDVRLASDLVGGLSTYYEVDSWDLRAKTLVQLAHSARDPETRAVIADAAFDLVERALADDRGDSAFELATLSMNLANAAKNISLREQARAMTERAQRMRKSLKAIEAANFKLSTDPSDPQANLVVGRYKCFAKQDWQAGWPYLAKGNDDALRSLAERELKPPLEPAEQVALADAWWDLAQQNLAQPRSEPKNEPEAIAMRARAVYWYHLALPSLSGISLAKAKKRSEAP